LYQLSDFWKQKTRGNAAILLHCFRSQKKLGVTLDDAFVIQ
jgi:hypothetical protein